VSCAFVLPAKSFTFGVWFLTSLVLTVLSSIWAPVIGPAATAPLPAETSRARAISPAARADLHSVDFMLVLRFVPRCWEEHLATGTPRTQQGQ
jgi:hypothetical protein